MYNREIYRIDEGIKNRLKQSLLGAQISPDQRETWADAFIQTRIQTEYTKVMDNFIQLMEEYHLFLAEYPQGRLRELQKELAQMEEETPKHKERALLQEKLRSLEAFLK